MLIAAGTLTEFLKFLQIFFWITIPLLFTSLIITTIVHYKRKNRKRVLVDEIPAGLLFQEEKDVPVVPGDQILRASLDQLNDFRHKLYFSNARYSVLKKDLEDLEVKYNDLLLIMKNKSSTKIFTMDQTAEKVHREMQFQIDRLNENYTAEKEVLIGHLNILNEKCQALELENNSLKEYSAFINNGNDENAFVLQLQKERSALKDKLSELQFTEDLLEEKKLHINLLQQQLDQRIKNYHSLEQQFADAAADNMKLKQQVENSGIRINTLENELMERDKQDLQLQDVFEQKNATISMLTEDIRIKEDRTNYLENSMIEVKQRNEVLNVAVMEKDTLISSLRSQLEVVEEKIGKLSSKLDINRKLMVKMHDEMTSVLKEENKSSPVIAMSPDYLMAGNEAENVASIQSL